MFEHLDRDPSVAVVVAGAAGVGKSRLAREITDRAYERGWSTKMVVGMKAAASIPFGAVAPLIDEPVRDASPVEMLAQARRVLTAVGGGPTRLLAVDDAQRLDPASATLVHQVVAEGICRTVLTVRTGEPVPDAIETLWTGGLAQRCDLGKLSRPQTGELLAAVLGAPVDGATQHRLWEASGGNVLYLRELVLGASAAGSLRKEGGLWRSHGSAMIPARLVELIERRVDNLAPDVRAALDVLALAERIDLDQISNLADVEALERLEDEGLAELVEEGGAPLVALAHPLYGEAVRAMMAVLRRRRVCATLADVVEAAGMPRPGDVVRVATWRLDAGQQVDPELLTAAAQRAYVANDYTLADRLGVAARTAGAGVPAGLVLAQSAMMSGRHREAASLLAALAAEAATDEERVNVAENRARVLGLYLGAEHDAVAVVDETLAVVTDPELIDPLRGAWGRVLAQVPRPAAAIDVVQPLLDRPASPSFYRAAYAASIALGVSGRLDEAVKIGRRGYEAHRGLGTAVRFLPEVQHLGPAFALLAAGRPREAAELVAKGYEAAVAARDSELQSAFALSLGRILIHQGRLSAAERPLREAAAVYQEINHVAALRWALGGIALAAGMRSARAESAAAVAELDALDPSFVQLYELDLVERGRAWAAAANGETSEAVAVLRAAAARAADTDQPVVEALLCHDLVRLGHARSEHRRLAALAARIGGDLLPALAEHAGALVAGAAAPLEAVAHRLAHVGAALVAHEAATDAAAAWRVEGYRTRAATCEELARRLAVVCEGARSPAAPAEGPSFALTAREQEVGVLAADGLTSREIAAKLYLSPRTVDNHIQRIYDKLGVSSRQGLAAVLKR